MAKIIIIGGIESTYKNAQVLHDLGEEILMFYTRGENSPGWEGVDMVDESKYPFAQQVKKTIVQGDINEHLEEMKKMKPDFIWSLGWQQMFKKGLLAVCPVLGIHEALLPVGAGACPIANAILHNLAETGITLFELDEGIDTGPIIAQLKCKHSPRKAISTEIYQEEMQLEEIILKMYVPLLNQGIASRIPQDLSKRTVYGKINWDAWPPEKVKRARTYPYK